MLFKCRFTGLFNLCLCSALILLLASCASRSPAYLASVTLEPITLPEGVDSHRLGELYPIPAAGMPAPQSFEVPFPPSVGVQDNANVASLLVSGKDFWIVNARPPAETWSQLEKFFQLRDIPVVARHLANADLDTGWFTEALQPGWEVRYRLHLERGLQPEFTDIYFFSQKRAVNDASVTDLVAIHDVTHARWLANQLVAMLNDVNKATVGNSYLATTINLPQKVVLTEHHGEPVLRADVTSKRLSQALRKALSQNGLLTYSVSDTHQVFHFDEYTVRRRGARWWNLFGDNDQLPRGAQKNSVYSVDEILAHLSDTPDTHALFPNIGRDKPIERLLGVKGYLLVIRPLNDEFVIRVRDGYGQLLPASQARGLLNTIYQRLL